jgi:hypothetical protein
MFDTPPTTPGTAIPTLARAAEYANAVIGAGDQTAEIRIAPGLYDPAAVFNCKVQFRASDPSQAGWPLIFPETVIGDASTNNNFFDGSGYGNLTSRVNFQTFRLVLRNSQEAGNNLHVNIAGRQIRCMRDVDFRGGFHFLGVPELIKLVADGAITAEQFLSGSVALPSGAFTTNTATNADTFLNQLRISNGRNANYQGFTSAAPLQLDGGPADVAEIRGIVFGPALPSRKESLDSSRAPYIATNGIVQLRFSNLYVRGSTAITSNGMGVTNDVPQSGNAHYGSTPVTHTSTAPQRWTWRQTHHTFLASTTESDQVVKIDEMGNRASYRQGTGAGDSTYYKNASTYLPNHIHLLTPAGAEPANNDDGPFFDQFIHVKRSFIVRSAFASRNSNQSNGTVSEGFVGKFGSNGYNSVKTRGVLLGNEALLEEERSAIAFLGTATRGSLFTTATSRTIFKLAGLAKESINEIPKFDAGAATFGEPNPVGAVDRKYNPVITAAAQNQGNGTFALNMALRSYVRGISPEHGYNITPNLVL